MSIKKALPSLSGNLPVSVDDEEGPEYWQHHVDSWIRSGLSQAAYCREHDLDYNRFRKWKERLSTYPSASTSIKLVEVKRDFTLNTHTDSRTPSSSFGPGVNRPGGIGGYAGMNQMSTGGSSGIRFWCGEFCIELDVKFSSDCLRQLIRTLQGVYINPTGDKTEKSDESISDSESD
jgi:hypothetical protein